MLPFDDQRVLCLEIPLQGKENVHINFAEEVEKAYGPSINRNVKKTEVSDSAESEGENEQQQGGPNGEAGAEPTKKRRKRRYADEYYDRNDPFIDDTELYIEEMAAASKDGFFVFSGPLVAEGDKVKIERSKKTKRKKKLANTLSNAAANPTPTTPQSSTNDQPATSEKLTEKVEEDSNDDEQPLQTISMHERASKQSSTSGSKKDVTANKSATNKETKKETQKSLKEQKTPTKETKSKPREKTSRRTSTGPKSTKKSEKEEVKGSTLNSVTISPTAPLHQESTAITADVESTSVTNPNDNPVNKLPTSGQPDTETSSGTN
ncbi:histone promoter control protein Hpc2 [Schizosaccharomyces octosporus yFS286]|uniref:Histone promoter control protein Hpc2 n=1 Tax=Schizosaccharomyces octosporus (strain yFS286) TaxID=483514 RepID=S9Q6E2_SCHOY|nr:histone promoter control protein Hpc2 [Schizosaccharomyces octosporus yFS286]EPX75198.1 histone promoter control protein Hpc2 [Schizosaccharomyces octosporus yFS286]